jgi:hypothetical protein
MALDHYVSQVHLRNFYSPSRASMYGIKKSTLERFPCRSENVCRIEKGSTNSYLIHDRAIEDFLRGVEPKYNESVAKLRSGKIDSQCIYVIAGFVSFITSCTPTAMRIHSEPLRRSVEAVAALLDRRGDIPKAPESLGGKSLTELLESGEVKIMVDAKYPQAIGISTVLNRISVYGNASWEILLNSSVDSPFFTSDYPIALEPVGFIPNWIVPLTPNTAIRIVPDIKQSGAQRDLTFKNFRFNRREVSRQEVLAINRLLVQCAEEIVFYRDDRPWVVAFVARNSQFRVEAETKRIPYGTGFLNWSTQRIGSVAAS